MHEALFHFRGKKEAALWVIALAGSTFPIALAGGTWFIALAGGTWFIALAGGAGAWHLRPESGVERAGAVAVSGRRC